MGHIESSERDIADLRRCLVSKFTCLFDLSFNIEFVSGGIIFFTFGVWIGVVCVEVSGVVKENIEALEPLVWNSKCRLVFRYYNLLWYLYWWRHEKKGEVGR